MFKKIALALSAAGLVAVPTTADAHGHRYGGYGSYGYSNYGYNNYGYAYPRSRTVVSIGVSPYGYGGGYGGYSGYGGYGGYSGYSVIRAPVTATTAMAIRPRATATTAMATTVISAAVTRLPVRQSAALPARPLAAPPVPITIAMATAVATTARLLVPWPAPSLAEWWDRAPAKLTLS